MTSSSHRALTQIICLAVLVSSITPVVAQSISAGERKHGFCASCHGINGQSFKVNYPILAGQAAPYILRQLRDFKQGRRSDPNMDPVAAQLSEEDMRDLAAFFAAQEPHSSLPKADPTEVIRGRKKADAGQCASCHLGRGATLISQFPYIQGQHRNYMVKQLMDFRSGRRANDSGVMHRIAQTMTDADIEDLGSYFATIQLYSRAGKAR